MIFEKLFCRPVESCRAILKGQFMRVVKGTICGLFCVQSIALSSQNGTGSLPARPGAWRTEVYFPLLQKKRVALVANPTSTIGAVHLVDSLRKSGIKITRVFAPEHGFRGDAANGEKIKSGVDIKTGIPVVSLYGNHYKPTARELHNVDVVVFDVQDVGVRFYTYLSTLHYVMQACAENCIQLLVLDRPNPNGYYLDGPILEPEYKSMVGLHPIPLVHGMTLGELARMINGEKWLGTRDSCKLTVIKVQNWHHNKKYIVPVAPSPNLPTSESITLYPTLGLLEGTPVSMGRGTSSPFECFGAPWLKTGSYHFVPRNIPGKATNPPWLGDTCRGILLSDFARNYLPDFKHLYVEWFDLLLKQCPDKNAFFTPFFDKLAGTATLRKQLLSGMSANEIRLSWKPGLETFYTQRAPYLLYPFDYNLGLQEE
ncbi:MAG: DUF1343 domain-containing protein [Bacteroidetes bacterium]|nr:DUF1343 domain-containing protein [Bacteroidota bacterium]